MDKSIILTFTYFGVAFFIGKVIYMVGVFLKGEDKLSTALLKDTLKTTGEGISKAFERAALVLVILILALRLY